ncbi:MAG: hypothetical protein H0U23_09420 [Blastocatellia bacterium]|nr:hypothetical protein [Blastocatellia bacterium]
MARELPASDRSPQLVENIDYYFDNGLMVLMERFLLARGYCCSNGCRHCPYPALRSDELE